MDIPGLLIEFEQKMRKVIEFAAHQLATLHTGKASPGMVEQVTIDVYGSQMKLRDIAAITTPDARLILIQPWDKGNLKAIEKGIQLANLGLNPAVEGGVIRCPIPELSRERRQELIKSARVRTEEGKVSLRSLRHEFMDLLKREAKSGATSEDDLKRCEKELQLLVDKGTIELNKQLEAKEEELLHS